MQIKMDELKKIVFYEMLNMAGRVFIMVRCTDDVIIGKRGFTEEEKKNGLVLVFNTKMNFTWDAYGLSGTLMFGTMPQECYVPAKNIIAINSPELNAQFVAAPQPQKEDDLNRGEPEGGKLQKSPEKTEGSKVVQVDFKKKRDKPRVPGKL